MTNSTNYTKTTQSSTAFGNINLATGALLLETGDYLLLEDGESHLLLEESELESTNYTSSSVNSTNYS